MLNLISSLLTDNKIKNFSINMYFTYSEIIVNKENTE